MCRILVVEDSRTQAEGLRLTLQAEGFAVTLAVDAEQALAAFSTSGFDLVLSDIIMPGLSGYDLCRKLKADPAKGNVPVILLTTLNDPLDILQSLDTVSCRRGSTSLRNPSRRWFWRKRCAKCWTPPVGKPLERQANVRKEP
jgi:CheY-like chemotaxis protein